MILILVLFSLVYYLALGARGDGRTDGQVNNNIEGASVKLLLYLYITNN